MKDSLETVNNPFEGNESIFPSTDNRATQRRKGKSANANFRINKKGNTLKFKQRSIRVEQNQTTFIDPLMYEKYV